MITLRGSPLRRPFVVSRRAPHFPGRGRHSPLRPPLARTIPRCTYQAITTNHRGGKRSLPPAILLLPPFNPGPGSYGPGRLDSRAAASQSQYQRPIQDVRSLACRKVEGTAPLGAAARPLEPAGPAHEGDGAIDLAQPGGLTGDQLALGLSEELRTICSGDDPFDVLEREPGRIEPVGLLLSEVAEVRPLTFSNQRDGGEWLATTRSGRDHLERLLHVEELVRSCGQVLRRASRSAFPHGRR